MKTTKKNAAPKSATTAEKATKKPTTAEKPTTATEPAPQEAPTAPADQPKETDTMKPDTTPETETDKPTENGPAADTTDNAPKANADNADKAADPAAAAVIPAQETRPARKYTAEEARTPQAAEAIRRTIIRAAAAAETAPTAAQLEAYEIELRAAAERQHGKAPRWTESHSVARLCYQLGLTAEEAAKAKNKTENKKALIEAAKKNITPTLAWQAILDISADNAAAKAIYQALVDEVDGIRTTLALFQSYLEETRKGGETAGVLPSKSEAAKERAALRRAIDKQAKQRAKAEDIYYRHYCGLLEEGETPEKAKEAAMLEAARYLREDLMLNVDEAKAIWEEAAKAYIPDPAFNADKATK